MAASLHHQFSDIAAPGQISDHIRLEKRDKKPDFIDHFNSLLSTPDL